MASELDREMTKRWASDCPDFRRQHDDYNARLGLIVDRCRTLWRRRMIGSEDCIGFSKRLQQLLQLLADGSDDPEWRTVAAKQIDSLAEIEPDIREHNKQRTRHPEATQLLTHLRKLYSDTKDLVEKEILMGRQMANVCDEVGGADDFRKLLTAECPTLNWKDVQHFMVIALDSPLAAKLDDDEEQ